MKSLAFALGFFVLSLATLWPSGVIHAQANTATSSDIKVAAPYRKVQVFDMTGMDIKGGLTAPMLTDINVRLMKIGKSLIKVRVHWKSKIKQSVHTL